MSLILRTSIPLPITTIRPSANSPPLSKRCFIKDTRIKSVGKFGLRELITKQTKIGRKDIYLECKKNIFNQIDPLSAKRPKTSRGKNN